MRYRLKKLRVEKGLTHKIIAEIVGIERSSYTNIELGKKNPSFIVASKIKKVLNYQGDDIFLNSTCQKGTNTNKAS